MVIDLERAEAISKIGLPKSHKKMQSFLGKINFVHRIVPNFAQVVKPLQFLVKKDVPFKWSNEQKNTFTKIRKAIAEVPALMSPYFSKYFILYTFSTDFSYAAVITYKNHEDVEILISFMSSTFKGVELNYSQVDKQAYTVYKSVKHYRPYLLNPRTKVIVPYASIHNVLVQKELGEKRAHWMNALQEYDLEIKPAKIVRGQGLCQLIAQSNDRENQQTNWEQEEATPTSFVNALETTTSGWFDHIKFFLHNVFSPKPYIPKIVEHQG